MGSYSDPITRLGLYKELAKSAGRDGVDRGEVDTLLGWVTTTAEEVGPALGFIAETFKQYTVHDIRHSCNLIRLTDSFLPGITRKKLNGLEIAFLILAALLHDSGMVVADGETAATLASDDFLRFRLGQVDRLRAVEEARAAGDEPRAEAIEDALLAEYFRRLHPERAGAYIRKLGQRFIFCDVDLTADLIRLCESHAWGFEQSLDPLHPEKAVVRLDAERHVGSVPLNLRYLSCCLRLADILDFDRSRTPLSVLELIDFSEEKSWEEWNKHLSVQGWKVTQRDVRFEAQCTHPAYYVAVQQFLDAVDHELRSSRFLIDHEPAELAERYQLHLPHAIDRRKVVMEDESYVAGGFRFQLEYEDILRLLMDRSLYPDPSLFLRELLQNALDACRRKEAHAKESGREDDYKPSIAVWDRSADPDDPRIVFQDNGVGMSLGIVERYFLRVGRSYYRSPEFEAERVRLESQGIELDASSQFGIGILSCFLVADRFEVETYQFGHDPLRIAVEGPTKYFVIQKLERPPQMEFPRSAAGDQDDGPPVYTGTRITVHLRPGAKVEVFETLETFAVNVDYPIHVYREDGAKPSVIARMRWEDPNRSDAWDELMKSGSFEEPPRSPEVLEKIFVQCYIPFEKWPFSAHLRGRAWLWLLRGESRPQPSRGYVHINWRLSLKGAALLAALMEDDRADRRKKSLWRKVLLSKGGDKDALAKLRPRYHDIQDLLQELQESERRELSSNWLDLPDREARELWLNNEEASLSLLAGDLRWASLPVRMEMLGQYLLQREQTPKIALHSILIPVGVVTYAPQEGMMDPYSFKIRAGGKLDIRGRLAPASVASRLFITEEEGLKIVQPFVRAALRFACDLAAEDGAGTAWREWVRYLGFTRHAFLLQPEDFQYCEERLGYLLKEGQQTTRVDRSELESRFGRRIPIAKDSRVGLPRNDFLTQILVRFGTKSREECESIHLRETEHVNLP